MKVYFVKVAGICMSYLGHSFREAEEVYNKSNCSAVLGTINERGVQVPIKNKEYKHSGVVAANLS